MIIEGYKYQYARFEQLPDVYVDSSKHKLAPNVNVSNINTIVREEKGEDKEFSFYSVQKN